MLIHKDKDKDLEIYATNNLLLVLKGEKIVKKVYFEEHCFVEDVLLELKEKGLLFDPLIQK